MLYLDHIAICASDLSEGVAWAERRLGMPMGPGGAHARFATHNRLLRLGDVYLEVIAPDPAATPERPRWFGLDRWSGGPGLANWICRCPDLDAALRGAPPCAGDAVDMARGDLRWRIAVPADGGLPMDGAFPTLIQWQGAHPLAALPNSGCRLRNITLRHPNAEAITARLQDMLVDFRVTLIPADTPSIEAVIETPGGLVTL